MHWIKKKPGAVGPLSMCIHHFERALEKLPLLHWIRELHTTGVLFLLYLTDTLRRSPLPLPDTHWQLCPPLSHSLLFSEHLSLWVLRWWWTAWPTGEQGNLCTHCAYSHIQWFNCPARCQDNNFFLCKLSKFLTSLSVGHFSERLYTGSGRYEGEHSSWEEKKTLRLTFFFFCEHSKTVQIHC